MISVPKTTTNASATLDVGIDDLPLADAFAKIVFLNDKEENIGYESFSCSDGECEELDFDVPKKTVNVRIYCSIFCE